MTAYAAPLRDMLFAMNEIGDLPAISALPGNEEASADLVEAILEEANKFASNVLAPSNYPGDRQGCKWSDNTVKTPDGIPQIFRDFCDNGWHAMPADVEFGGQGLPNLVSTPVLEMWKSSNIAFSLCQMLTLGAVSAIAHHGSDEMKALYLPKMVAGEWTGTMNLTEPQAGSDLSAVRTRAVPEGDHYRISGTKIFITWGEHDVADNIVHLVLARLPDAPPGVKGISLFIAPKFLVNADGSLGERNDLVCSSIEHKLGIHGSPTAVMSFGDKGGAIGYLVGQLNRGLEYMFTMMNHARLNVGLEGLAISERAYQAARNYARDRVQGRPYGQPAGAAIVHHPDVRRMLLDMKSRIDAMRAIAYYTAGQMDRAHQADGADTRIAQATVDLLTPVVKAWCTENSIQIASTGIQVHGGMGFVEETGAAQHLRDARITTIYEGTTGIQSNDLVGRKIARDKGVTVAKLIAEMRSDATSLPYSAELLVGVDAVEKAVAFILATNDLNPERVAAGAVPFLHLFGSVVGGWLVLKAAAKAKAKAAVEGDDTGFYASKEVIAQHYATHVLPHAAGYLSSILNGSASTLGFAEDQF